MATPVPEGLLVVSPVFDNGSRPGAILVTVAYQQPYSAALTDPVLDEVIKEAKRQMQPEFEVVGRFERLPGGTIVEFIITQNPGLLP